ncbi:MAG: flagellar basal-body rod protein FlgF [Spirochaetia bacterium]
MIRGLFTGASGMIAQMHRLDAIANNLANVDLNGYKRDEAVFKSFPELLIRRMNDDGVYSFNMGSVDTSPIVGKLGTGVELNEVYTVFDQGPLKPTGRDLDFALQGKGFFSVGTKDGERYTRNGDFFISPEGYLVTKSGDFVLGENGPIKLKEHNFIIDEDGVVYQNASLAGDDERMVSVTGNPWDNTERVDRLKLVHFEQPRYLEKKGDSYWQSTTNSGAAQIVPENQRPKVRSGFIEGSNVNSVREMVDMIEVNRIYEANQKLIQSQDSLLGKLINDAARV